MFARRASSSTHQGASGSSWIRLSTVANRPSCSANSRPLEIRPSSTARLTSTTNRYSNSRFKAFERPGARPLNSEASKAIAGARGSSVSSGNTSVSCSPSWSGPGEFRPNWKEAQISSAGCSELERNW
ncbi:hypothetical protein D9M71_742500 [compost metagenome]